MNTPLFRALAAGLYIVGIVFLINNLPESEENLLFPMVMLCLLVLSAMVMAYLFLWEPVRMYWDNKKKEAMNFFLKTLGYFGLLAAIAVVTLFYYSGGL